MMNKKSDDRRTFLKSGVLVGSTTLFSSLTLTTDAKGATSTEASIWQIFPKRRSVRKYKPDAVPEKDILRILDAARSAPTSGNQQPWKFVVIQDKDKINQLKEACIKAALAMFDERKSKTQTREQFENRYRSMMSGYFSAPVYIVVLTDNNSKYPTYNHWDGPLAAGYLMLAARALGYGTVHITDSIPESVTKEVLRIPDHYTRVCITPVGIPVEWPDSPPKKKLKEFIAYESL
ncbi:MAG: nitroreductase family protein [Planctomycetota bacterium]